jgi:hypothetical protein
MPCRCKSLRELLLAVGAEPWVTGSCSCWQCSPHWSDSSSPVGQSRPDLRGKRRAARLPAAAIPGKARPTEQLGDVPRREFEHPVDPVEWT